MDGICDKQVHYTAANICQDMAVWSKFYFNPNMCCFSIPTFHGLIIPYGALHPHIMIFQFYNNFFIADLNFFLSPQVQDWLRFADKSGKIYRERLGDLILQTAAVYAFANKSQIHRFLDFTYEHFSRDDDGCPRIGALAAGYDDPQATAFENQLREEKTLWSARGCRKRRKISIIDLRESQLSPSYHHLPPHLLNLTLRVVKAGGTDYIGAKIGDSG